MTEKISEGSPMVRDLDDFLGGARTEEELGDLMEKFLERCQSGGVYLNPTKFNIALDGESVLFCWNQGRERRLLHGSSLSGRR